MLTLLVGSSAATPLVVPSGGCVRPGNGPDLTCTFDYTGATESWTVPDGVSSVTFDLFGAHGGSFNGTGGKGGEVIATLPVTAGDTLDIAVGQLGIGGCPPFGDPFSAQAFGGGAAGRCGGTGSGGGGASSVSSSGTRLLVAGGGGGAASGNTGGPGGNETGGDGLPAAPTDEDGEGGKGGTQSAGGAAGAESFFGPGNVPPGYDWCDTNADPASGTSGSGGVGGEGASNFHGGSGGGGYFGGGGGGGGAYCTGGPDLILGSAGSGGGGSSFAEATATDVSMNAGVRQGNGVATVTFSSPDLDGPPGVTIDQASGQTDPTATSPIVFSAVFSEPVTGFASADVSITGTAGGTKSVSVTEVAPLDGTTYDVSVTGMTTSGSVIASIPAGGATGADFSTNDASTSSDDTVTWQPDNTPPTTTIALNPTSPNGNNGWYTSQVGVSISATDDSSGVAETRCELDSSSTPASFDDLPSTTCAYLDPGANVTSEGEHTVYAASVDNDGNEEDPVSASFKIDMTGPTVTCPTNPIPTFTLGSTGNQVTATVGDAVSGPVSTTATAAAPASSVGVHGVNVTGEDNAGNTTTTSCSYLVAYTFTGFFNPVANPPAINFVKAGSGVALKFSLAGNQGLNIFAAGYPASVELDPSCLGIGLDAEPTFPAGKSGLSYNPTTDTYSYNWKTQKSWKGTCRQFVLGLNDGSAHVAFFKFK